MSMFTMLHGVTPEFLQACLADSARLGELSYPNDAENNSDFLDTDKTWGALTFMLGGDDTGMPDDDVLLSQAALGAEIIDEEYEMGMTPAFYLTPEQVAQLAAEIGALSDEELLGRYRPDEMEDIYPCEWPEDDEETLEWLLQYFHALQAFYAEQARKGHAVISYLT